MGILVKKSKQVSPIEQAMTSMSPVNEMFNGRSVFITGASGFIGRVLLEKLLRTYAGIKKVYILMRAKGNMSAQERLEKQLLAVPIFDHLRSMDASNEPKLSPLLDKIHVIEGDISQDNLGVSESDHNMLMADESLSIVYHLAASIRFNDKLKNSVKFNIIATRTVVNLCKRLGDRLVAFCHISTAFVNSDIKDESPIMEKVYPMKLNPDELIEMIRRFDDNVLEQLTPGLLGDKPNTYTYTKAVAEKLILEEARGLPVAIVRPSIVVGAWKEPIPGWVDSLNGPIGLLVAFGKGLVRTICVERKAVADLVPVDICVNMIIAASYFVAEQPKQQLHIENNHIEPESPLAKEQPQSSSPESTHKVNIFHCTSGDINPIRWGDMEDNFRPIVLKYPSQQVFRYPGGTFKRNKYHDLVTRIFVHYLPALLIDLVCFLTGRKRKLLSLYWRMEGATSALAYFATKTFNFKTDNLAHLKACLLDPRDKQDLQLDMKSLNWVDFWDTFALGARRFILKEEDETLEKSRRLLRRAYYVEMVIRSILLLLLAALLFYLVPFEVTT